MKITKYEHACVVLEKGGEKLVIDPGAFTSLLPDTSGVVGVVVTHEHPDHWTPEQLKGVLNRSAGVRLLGPQGVADAAQDFDVEVVSPGDDVEVGSFRLRFFGGRHAVIHASIPVIDNVGVLVDDEFYYAGDSFEVPDVEVGTLAAPAGAPWMKIAESMDYVVEVKPQRAFATHEMVLSAAGKGMSHARLEWATQQGGGQYFPLEAGQSIDV